MLDVVRKQVPPLASTTTLRSTTSFASYLSLGSSEEFVNGPLFQHEQLGCRHRLLQGQYYSYKAIALDFTKKSRRRLCWVGCDQTWQNTYDFLTLATVLSPLTYFSLRAMMMMIPDKGIKLRKRHGKAVSKMMTELNSC